MLGRTPGASKWPSSQKERQKWLTRLDAVGSAHEGCPTTRFVSVGHRETKVYDLLAAERPEGVELVMRASWDRAARAPERYVWAHVEALKPGGYFAFGFFE